MNEKKPNKKLDLSRDNIDTGPVTPEQAAKSMADFYNTMGNCLVNMVAIHNELVKTIRDDIGVDLNDLAFYTKKIAIKMDAVNEMEIEEHENEGEEPPPANSEKP